MAEAAYVLFDQLQNNYSDGRVAGILKDSSAGGYFSQSQAEDFVNTWQVISHTPNTGSYFSATLFQRKGTNEYVYALRGTEGFFSWDLWVTDLNDIVPDSLALNQIVDMYNDWQYLNAARIANLSGHRAYITSWFGQLQDRGDGFLPWLEAAG